MPVSLVAFFTSSSRRMRVVRMHMNMHR
jgi:hypothetical protein